MDSTRRFLDAKLECDDTSLTEADFAALTEVMRPELEAELRHEFSSVAIDDYWDSESLSRRLSMHVASILSGDYDASSWADNATIGDIATSLLLDECDDTCCEIHDRFVDDVMARRDIEELREFVEESFPDDADSFDECLRDVIGNLCRERIEFKVSKASLELAVIPSDKIYTTAHDDREAVLAACFLHGAPLCDALKVMARMSGGKPEAIELDDTDDIGDIVSEVMAQYADANNNLLNRYSDWAEHTQHDGNLAESDVAEMVDCTSGYYMQPAVVVRLDSDQIFGLRPGEMFTFRGSFVIGVYDCRNGSAWQQSVNGKFTFVPAVMAVAAAYDEDAFGEYTIGKEVAGTYGSRATYSEIVPQNATSEALKQIIATTISQPSSTLDLDLAI